MGRETEGPRDALLEDLGRIRTELFVGDRRPTQAREVFLDQLRVGTLDRLTVGPKGIEMDVYFGVFDPRALTRNPSARLVGQQTRVVLFRGASVGSRARSMRLGASGSGLVA
jgi:hypothetical protein